MNKRTLTCASLTLFALCLSVPVSGQTPRTVSTNYAIDMEGAPDTRSGTWGSAGFHDWKMAFHPPAGQRVRILRVYGDFIAYVRRPGNGMKSGVLFSLMTTGNGASSDADYAADGCFLFLQGAVDGSPFRGPFDQDVSDGGLLRPDNILVVRAAVFLNETGQTIHIEPTFVIVFQFEPAAS